MPSDAATACGEKLVALRVLSVEEHERVLDAIPHKAGERGENAYLVAATQAGLLTRYQSDRVAAGEAESIVLGDYKLLYKAAAGGFARVFRAVSLEDGRSCALKLLKEGRSSEDGEVARFYREAKLLKRLRHRNIVPIYDIGQVGDSHFFTMEFVGGGNLKDLVRTRGAYAGGEATAIVYQIVAGLAAAARQNVQHRDIKPSNVLMGEDGVVKLVDFGLAVYDDPYGLNEDRTVEYMTLEKYSKAPVDDPRSDLFFVGAVYYQLLTGRSPFGPAKTLEERKNPTRYREIRPARTLVPTLDPRVNRALEQLLMFRPTHRYQSADVALGALREVLTALDEPIPGRPNPRPALPSDATAEARPMVLCIDHRPNAQKRLREYLSRRGYRALIFGDADRALRRLRNGPVAAVVLVGDSLGDEVFDLRRRIVDAVPGEVPVCVHLLTDRQRIRRGEIDETARNVVMVEPVTLRELRKAINHALNPHESVGDSRAGMRVPHA